MAPQMNSYEDDNLWGIWFGDMKDPVIKKRFEFIMKYLQKRGGIDKDFFCILPN